MTPRQALNVLQQASAKFLGTLEDHQTLQQAVKIIDDLVTKGEQPMDETPAEETVEQPVAAPEVTEPVVEPAPAEEPVTEPSPEEPAPAETPAE